MIRSNKQSTRARSADRFHASTWSWWKILTPNTKYVTLIMTVHTYRCSLRPHRLSFVRCREAPDSANRMNRGPLAITWSNLFWQNFRARVFPARTLPAKPWPFYSSIGIKGLPLSIGGIWLDVGAIVFNPSRSLPMTSSSCMACSVLSPITVPWRGGQFWKVFYAECLASDMIIFSDELTWWPRIVST